MVGGQSVARRPEYRHLLLQLIDHCGAVGKAAGGAFS